MLEQIVCVRARKTRWQYFLLLVALLPMLLVLNSCGSGSSTPPTITVSCDNTSINVNGTVQCTATILNLSSTLVNWQVNSVTSGNATFGTIDTNGLYTAPKAVPTNNVVTITAQAQAQTSLTATASITVLPPAVISGVSCVNANQQNSQTVSAGNSLDCTPTVAGGGNIAVFWYVNNSATCSSTLGPLNGRVTVNGIDTFPYGNMTGQGVYTAPNIPPAGAAVAITAVSQVDATQTFCLPITLTYGNASLTGSYAFSTSGRLTSGNSFFARVGSFTAANGALISGTEDSNEAGVVRQSRIFTGTYSITPDGRGQMQFCEDISTPCTSAASTLFFRFVVDSDQQAQIIDFGQPSGTSAPRTGSGEMNLQDASVFTPAGLVGTYSFKFAGASAANAPQTEVGEFTSNGQGVISADSPTTPGRIDINNAGVQTIAASTYSISTNGRGTATIAATGGPFTFSFYMISASRAKFIETDSSAVLAGDAFKQQTSSCTWSAGALNGLEVFELGGTGTNGGIADLVSFSADGAGNVTSGSVDENSGGTVSSTQSLSGTYTIDACGRGTLNIASHSYVFYVTASGNSVIQETTAGVASHGFMLQPQGGPFTTASLTGSYALGLSGTNAAGTAGNRIDLVGQLSANGTGNVTGSNLDINSFGATQTGVSSIGTYTSVAANGRATMLFNSPTRNLVFYFVSPTQIYVLDTDTTGTAAGIMLKQF